MVSNTEKFYISNYYSTLVCDTFGVIQKMIISLNRETLVEQPSNNQYIKYFLSGKN